MEEKMWAKNEKQMKKNQKPGLRDNWNWENGGTNGVKLREKKEQMQAVKDKLM